MKRIEPLIITAEESHVRKEKSKARSLRKSQWWKNQLAKSTCYYCGKRFDVETLTMDHKVPISRGGLSNRSNVVVSCKDCNNRKKYLLPAEWHKESNS